MTCIIPKNEFYVKVLYIPMQNLSLNQYNPFEKHTTTCDIDRNGPYH